jgi:hypothetical protein
VKGFINLWGQLVSVSGDVSLAYQQGNRKKHVVPESTALRRKRVAFVMRGRRNPIQLLGSSRGRLSSNPHLPPLYLLLPLPRQWPNFWTCLRLFSYTLKGLTTS